MFKLGPISNRAAVVILLQIVLPALQGNKDSLTGPLSLVAQDQ